MSDLIMKSVQTLTLTFKARTLRFSISSQTACNHANAVFLRVLKQHVERPLPKLVGARVAIGLLKLARLPAEDAVVTVLA